MKRKELLKLAGAVLIARNFDIRSFESCALGIAARGGIAGMRWNKVYGLPEFVTVDVYSSDGFSAAVRAFDITFAQALYIFGVNEKNGRVPCAWRILMVVTGAR